MTDTSPESLKEARKLHDPEAALYSDEMDRAVSAWTSTNWGLNKNAERAGEKLDGETAARRCLAAAIKAFLDESLAIALALDSAKEAGRREALKTLASAMRKFAPEAVTDLARKWADANGALDDFLAALRAPYILSPPLPSEAGNE